MIVWGGTALRKYADGAAYDPAERTWRTLAPAPLAARSRQVAVWTGREMLVWGGTAEPSGVGGLRDGAAYDPDADTRRTIAASPPGTDRVYAQAVVAGGRVVVAGGGGPTEGAVRSVLVYDPVADAWTEHRLGHPVDTLAAVGGTVVLAGVERTTGEVRAEVFDPVTGARRDLPRFPADERTEWIGLVAAGRTAALAAGGTSHTRVALIDPAAGGGWRAATRVGLGDFVPGVGVAYPFKPGLDAWTGRWLLAWSPSGLRALAPGTDRTASPDGETPCGSNGAAVWTGTAVLEWGGQDCRVDRGRRWTAAGVEVRAVAR
jgi:hypothetical protein